MLTTPVAVPSVGRGLNVREIEPDHRPRSTHRDDHDQHQQQPQRCAGRERQHHCPDRGIADDDARTTQVRRCGAVRRRNADQDADATAAPTDTVSSSARDRMRKVLAPRSRYGTPHQRKVVTENCVPCGKKPESGAQPHGSDATRSPHRDGMFGNRTAVRRVLDQDDREHRRQHAEAGRRQIGGASWRRRAAPRTAPPTAPDRIAHRCRSAGSGYPALVEPVGTSRSTEMNVKASPTPSTARAAMAIGNDSLNARVSCPAAIRNPPMTIITREPKRSTTGRPGGATAYMLTWRTTNDDSTRGWRGTCRRRPGPRRARVVRSRTATT